MHRKQKIWNILHHVKLKGMYLLGSIRFDKLKKCGFQNLVLFNPRSKRLMMASIKLDSSRRGNSAIQKLILVHRGHSSRTFIGASVAGLLHVFNCSTRSLIIMKANIELTLRKESFITFVKAGDFYKTFASVFVSLSYTSTLFHYALCFK